jgi:hypothetical protein
MPASRKPRPSVRRIPLIATATLFALVLGCAELFGPKEDILTLDVASARVPCQGAFPQQCYRVRQQPDTNWTLFYDSIEGFDYQAGFEYTIRVARRPVRNPPADASSFAYRLLSILRQVPA